MNKITVQKQKKMGNEMKINKHALIYVIKINISKLKNGNVNK